MLPIIASIPAAEFDPHSPNFHASVHQVFATMALVLPEIPEAALDAVAAVSAPLRPRGRWLKKKGFVRVQLEDGTIRRAKVHWYEAHGIGKKEIKLKRLVEG